MTTTVPPGDDAAAERQGRQRFAWTLTGVTVFALVIRVVYVLMVTRYVNDRFYDAFYYVGQSALLADGHGFQNPVVGGAAAAHPPLTSVVEVPATWLFGVSGGVVPQRMTMVVLGALTVAVIGLVAAAVAGRRVGIVAAVIAALYPNLWIPNGIVMSETLAILVTALLVLGTYRLLRHADLVSAALVGLGVGAATMTRSELAAFVALLLVPGALLARRVPMRRRLGLCALGIVVAGLVSAPWIIRNLVTFRDPTYLSTGDGGVLLGANCDPTYHGPGLGYWSLTCSIGVQPSKDASVLSARQSHAALTYLRHHTGRLPVVVAARVGRLWDVFRPFQTARFDQGEGRPLEASWAGIWAFYLLAPLAIAGIFVLGRAGATRWPLLMPVVLVTILAAATYGIVRFRAPAEVSIVVLAAVAVDAGWRRLRPRAPTSPGATAAAPASP